MSYIIAARIRVDDSAELEEFIEHLIRQGCHVVEHDRYLDAARPIRSASNLVKHDEEDLVAGRRFRYECSFETTNDQKANDLWSYLIKEPLVISRSYTYINDMIPSP